MPSPASTGTTAAPRSSPARLRDAGFEVIYTGIRQRIEDIASIAVQEDVAVVGLSILSGAHLALTARTIEALRAADAADIAVVVGGTIPHADVPKLLSAGAAAVFPTGTPLDVLVRDIRALDRHPATCLATSPGGTVRIGVMIGPERGDSARKVTRMLADIDWAETAGLDTAWIPQIPNDFDALVAVALLGTRTHPDRTGHRGRSAAGAAPDCVGPSGIVGARRHRRPAGAGRRAVAPLDRGRHARAFPTSGPPHTPATTSKCWTPPSPTLARSTSRTTPSECTTRSTLGPVAPLPVLVAALGPVMLTIAGERADGTVLWMADERAVAEHVVPRITKAADNAGRPAPRIVAGVPVCLCGAGEVDAARERANRILGEAEVSPNYQRLLGYGDAKDVGDICAAGDEDAILARLRRFADAGVTDLSVRLLPIGDNRDELVASKRRTREMIASLATELR